VTGAVGDQAVHLLAHTPIRGVPLGRGSQLDDVHRLARVHIHVEANAIGHRDRVRGGGLEPGRSERLVEIGRRVHDAGPAVEHAGFAQRVRLRVAVPG
jgi:hypothetical protein